MAINTEKSKEKAIRIADYLGIGEAFALAKDIDKNPDILYGKFDPINLDKFGNQISELMSRPHSRGASRSTAFKSYNRFDTEELVQKLSNLGLEQRSTFYVLNIILSQRGVAPRWRGIKRPSIKGKDSTSVQAEIQRLRDIQVFDLEWLWHKYSDLSVDDSYQEIFTQMIEGKPFDFALAHMISCAEITAEKKIDLLNLTSDMQDEMCMLRDKTTITKERSLSKKSLLVERDLRTAANNNRRRGNKLLAVLPDRLRVWMSANITPNAAESVMINNYKKMTGETINRSTFRSRLRALNDVLKEVGSKYLVT